MKTTKWIKTEDRLPAEKIVVDTISPDGNQQRLFRYKNLWFLEDGSMYVYYTPTHWKIIIRPISDRYFPN